MPVKARRHPSALLVLQVLGVKFANSSRPRRTADQRPPKLPGVADRGEGLRRGGLRGDEAGAKADDERQAAQTGGQDVLHGGVAR